MPSPDDARRALTRVTGMAGAELDALLAKVRDLTPEQVRDALHETMPGLALRWGDIAATLSAELYAAQRDAAGAAGAYSPTLAPVAEGRVPALVGWATAPALALTPDPTAVTERLTGGFQRLVADAFRATTVLNVSHDREAVGWARHASANACAFCALLATRSVLYRSEESATRVVGHIGGKDYRAIERDATRAGVMAGTRRKTVAQGGRKRSEGARPLGERYHDGCHCMAVAVFKGETYEPPPYVADWMQAYLDAPGGTNLTAALSSMRKTLDTN